MATTKVSLTFDTDLLEAARLASGGNLSSYVNEAVAHKIKNDQLGRGLAEMDRELGPVPSEILEETDRTLREAVALLGPTQIAAEKPAHFTKGSRGSSNLGGDLIVPVEVD